MRCLSRTWLPLQPPFVATEMPAPIIVRFLGAPGASSGRHYRKSTISALSVDWGVTPGYYYRGLMDKFRDSSVTLAQSRHSRRPRLRWSRGAPGQSFVELTLIVVPLMLLIAGIAEYGVLLNRYLNAVDGAREAARYNANYNPFCPELSTDPLCPPGTVTAEYYSSTAVIAEQVLYPVVLDPTLGDDIIVSFFTVSGGVVTGRYPLADGESGWSWSEHKDGYGVRNQVSKQDTAFIESRMDNTAPDISVSLVEIFYNYPQTLRMPILMDFVPDPIPVYTYAIMPIKNVSPPSP
jgi:hypothetical protein